MDISREQAGVSRQQKLIEELPEELLESILAASKAQFLDALAIAALNPLTTTTLFAHFEKLFADICARWTTSKSFYSQSLAVSSTLARILPFAPQLTVFAERLISGVGPEAQPKTNIWAYLGPQNEFDPTGLPEEKLQQLLLSAF